MRFFLTGFMGSGKSFWGKKLSAKYEMPFFDLDEVIESSEGKSITTIFEEMGEPVFRQIEANYLKQCILEQKNFIMSTGGGTPCFQGNMELMNSKGISIYLKADIDIIVQRLKSEQSKRPLISHLNENTLTEFVQHKLEEREMYYKMAKHIVEVNSANEIIFGDIILKYV